jgi:hypothetical protein
MREVSASGVAAKVFCVLLLVTMILQGVLHGDSALGRFVPDYLHPRNRPYKLGDQYCGAYAVWHAIRYFGLRKSISNIVEEMSIDETGSTNLRSMAEYLTRCGLSVRVVRLDTSKVHKVNRPFIPYIYISSTEERGHFVFCVPDDCGNIIELDGLREPVRFDITLLRDVDRDEWDGTVILFDTGRQLVTARSLMVMVLVILSVPVVYRLLKLSSRWCYRDHLGRSEGAPIS